MGHGFRTMVRLAATAAAAAAVGRAAESARRLIEELVALDQPRRPALSPPLGLTSSHEVVAAAPAYHAFGPAPSVVPSRGIGFRTTIDPPPTAVAPAQFDELEASGELDDADEDVPDRVREAPHVEVPAASPIDRLIARRHASDTAPTPQTDRPARAGPGGRHRREPSAESSTIDGSELSMTVPLTGSAVTLRLAVGPQNTLTVTVSLPGATVDEPL
jgi:hypothetical protein